LLHAVGVIIVIWLFRIKDFVALLALLSVGEVMLL